MSGICVTFLCGEETPYFMLLTRVCEEHSSQLFWFVKAKLQKSRFLHFLVILLWKLLWLGCYVKEEKKCWSQHCLEMPVSSPAYILHP